MIGEKVYTRFGKGRVVYLLPDETVLVEFDGGWGKVLSREETFNPDRESQSCRRQPPIDSWQRCAG